MLSQSIRAVTQTDGTTLQDQVYDQLRRLIMRGEIGPGQALTIRSAANALGVSMMPVRAALKRLESEGALVARGGKRVLGIPELSADGYREIRAIRLQLEGLATEKAAESMTDTELAEAERFAGEMQRAAEEDDRDRYVAANWEFHLSIYRASHMPLLVGLIEAMWLRVGPYVATMMPDRESLVSSMPAHWDVIEAIRRRDGRAARKGITADIGGSGKALIAALERRSAHAASATRASRAARVEDQAARVIA